jgi:hypothetical protein
VTFISEKAHEEGMATLSEQLIVITPFLSGRNPRPDEEGMATRDECAEELSM